MFEDIKFVTDADSNRSGVIITIEDYEELLASSEEVIREPNLNSQESVDPIARQELTTILQDALSDIDTQPKLNHHQKQKSRSLVLGRSL
ncbi:MAG TPA: hypothetical protein DC054_21275 [Blastocatellia bacterium]|nr:hypothetical protein [Blastocatellia bacterium]